MSPPVHPSTPRIDAAAVQACLRRAGAAATPPWLHVEVARRMAERLPLVRLQPERVVDWWGFLGAGGPHLQQAYPKAQRRVVEPTDALCARSLEATRAPWWSSARWRASNQQVQHERDTVPPGAQLVWANMMLHAVPDPLALMQRWQRILAPDGFVMFSCLGPDTVRELRELYARLGWPAPTIDFVDMHDLGDMLVEAGFADPVMDQETLTLQWESPQALLSELRTLGGNASPQRAPGWRTPRWRARLERELQTLAVAATDGTRRLGLRFEVAYGHAFKALPRPQRDGRTVVSVEDMRAMARARRTSR